MYHLRGGPHERPARASMQTSELHTVCEAGINMLHSRSGRLTHNARKGENPLLDTISGIGYLCVDRKPIVFLNCEHVSDRIRGCNNKRPLHFWFDQLDLFEGINLVNLLAPNPVSSTSEIVFLMRTRRDYIAR